MMKVVAQRLLLAVCLVASATVSAADQSAATDPVWGHYAQLVGRTASAGPLQYELHWQWSIPGRELVQEYRHPIDGTVKHREVITPGAAPGTLVLQGWFWGKKQWDGTLQPDGNVLYIGRSFRKLPHVAGFLADGTWGHRLVDLQDGRITSIAAAPHQYRLTPSANDAVAASATIDDSDSRAAVVAPIASGAPAATTADTAPVVAASTPAAGMPPTASVPPHSPPAAAETPLAQPAAWGALARLANRSIATGDGGSLYLRVTADGTAIYAMTMWPGGEAIPNTIYRLAGNGLVIRRSYNHSQSGRETFYRGVAIDWNTIRWFRVGSSPGSYSDWTFHESSGRDGMEGSYTIVPSEVDEIHRKVTFDFGSQAHVTDQLAAAIAKTQVQDVGIVARANQRWQEYLANNSGATTTNGWASALYSGLSAGLEVARVQEARSRYELESTLAGIDAEIAVQQRMTPQSPASPTSQQQSARGAPVAAAQSHVAQATNEQRRPASGEAPESRRAPSSGGTGSWETAGGGRPSTTLGAASTRDDASSCVSAPVTSRHACGDLVGYKGIVSNSCSVPVDVKMCFMTATGWNCQTSGLRPGQTWEPGWCHANTGQVFYSVGYPDRKAPLASP